MKAALLFLALVAFTVVLPAVHSASLDGIDDGIDDAAAPNEGRDRADRAAAPSGGRGRAGAAAAPGGGRSSIAFAAPGGLCYCDKLCPHFNDCCCKCSKLLHQN